MTGQEFDPHPLLAAARAYSKAVVKTRAAYKAHEKNDHLDEFNPKSVRTENRVFRAEQDRDDRLEDLRVAALIYTGGEASELGRELLKLVERSRNDR